LQSLLNHPIERVMDINAVQKFLVHPTSALHVSQSIFERLKEVLRVKEIASLIVDPMIPMDAVAGIIGILASLMHVKGQEKGKKLSYKHVLPTHVRLLYTWQRIVVYTPERDCTSKVFDMHWMMACPMYLMPVSL
jgi:hypothetical protein